MDVWRTPNSGLHDDAQETSSGPVVIIKPEYVKIDDDRAGKQSRLDLDEEKAS